MSYRDLIEPDPTVVARVTCPGCLSQIWADEMCCDECWRRTPLRLKTKLRVIAHMAKNWPAYTAAQQAIEVWLSEHRSDHFEARKYPSP